MTDVHLPINDNKHRCFDLLLFLLEPVDWNLVWPNLTLLSFTSHSSSWLRLILGDSNLQRNKETKRRKNRQGEAQIRQRGEGMCSSYSMIRFLCTSLDCCKKKTSMLLWWNISDIQFGVSMNCYLVNLPWSNMSGCMGVQTIQTSSCMYLLSLLGRTVKQTSECKEMFYCKRKTCSCTSTCENCPRLVLLVGLKASIKDAPELRREESYSRFVETLSPGRNTVGLVVLMLIKTVWLMPLWNMGMSVLLAFNSLFGSICSVAASLIEDILPFRIYPPSLFTSKLMDVLFHCGLKFEGEDDLCHLCSCQAAAA